MSFNVIFAWEMVNHFFNVYASIGCLDGKKPISTYSSDPINTLLSGLRNTDPNNQLSKLTALQELAYISTVNTPEGVKLRTAIYSAHSTNRFIWPAILDECTILIKQTTQRINYRSSADAKVLQKSQLQVKDDIRSDQSGIFGNSFVMNTERLPDSNVRSYDELVDASKKVGAKPTQSNQQKYFELIDKHLLIPLNRLLASLLSESKAKDESVVVAKLKPVIKQVLNVVEVYRNNFLATSLGIPFRVSLKRDTESRVLNAVNYGNAVISVANLLVHAIEEDRNFSISNQHISDALNLLERPIRGCAVYVDHLPASVFLTLGQRKADVVHSKHLITLLHDLTLFNFKLLCVAYNYKLNDLLLSAPCFKLAKRVIDEEIATRQKK
ncbi:hypothetical protein CANTEDRAFT_114312 [Yamadazyma tenuis ATCC 10573]|nr:uncharacterized protein CANTEDRAFT_114312 [Yamadazyma tenuis ATCC 10573]EGV63510.1 hypothetical protein CANTEDRAFT_114312 [Yamadazyma tenuis ATCC 10573]